MSSSTPAHRTRQIEGGATLDVWWTGLEAGRTELEGLAALLSADETRACRLFRFERDRRRYIVRHARLRQIMARYLNYPPIEVPVVTSPLGRPQLVGNGLTFSVSHSGEMAVFAVARGIAIGCDIERRDCRTASAEMAELFMSRSELQYWNALPPQRQTAAFFRCWTRKEAWLKALGIGLARPMKTFEIARTDPPRIRDASSGILRGWSLHDLKILPGYAAAVAARTAALRVEMRRWTRVENWQCGDTASQWIRGESEKRNTFAGP